MDGDLEYVPQAEKRGFVLSMPWRPLGSSSASRIVIKAPGPHTIRSRMSPSALRNRLLIAGAVFAVVMAAAVVVLALTTWGDVNRVTIERPEGDSGETASSDDESAGESKSDEVSNATDPGREIFLLVGSDSREDLVDTEGFGEFEGNRADVVMVLIKDGASTGLLSLPRDLLIADPCNGDSGRVSSMLEGCDVMNGATLLTLAVEAAIGQPIDHLAMVDLAGFQEAVDVLGGYEICVENPVRDTRANLELPAGCTMADGAQTLAWMRSRRTQELTANGWRVLPGMNDLVRNERQRAFLLEIMGRMADFTSPQAMTSTVRVVAPFLTVDDDLTLFEAVDVAWTLRGYGSASVVQLEVPVYDATTASGAQVLMASIPVDEIVSDFLSGVAADSGVVVGTIAN